MVKKALRSDFPKDFFPKEKKAYQCKALEFFPRLFFKEKKALLLLSGGFDSPVAGLIAREKGFEIHAVHFSFMPLTDNSALEKSRKISKQLKFKEFIEVPFDFALQEIAGKTERKAYFVLIKRMMFRIAERIARKRKLDALVSGESLGQVSSQTLDNLAVITRAVEIPVLRPLLSMTKEEIIALSEKNGLFELSKGPEMCDPLGIKRPFTRMKEEQLLREEEKLDLRAITENAVERMKGNSA